ncbi:NAD-dependent epimerase/dehydratase family protein [Pseudaminobacter sp. NGMCC 1.201702]|uniref:NAD-dependent epimerase/dehydratase family protein n=1 Tax=Pseudaminobacter sp. NGMCC 1.201702 TaxID=3391825 RepID=UPI0039EE1AF2
MDRILVTGTSGFVGRHLLTRLKREGRELTLAGRSFSRTEVGRTVKTLVVGEIGPRTDWSAALEGCGIVIHMAGQVPGPGVSASDFDTVNNEGTARLAEQAFASGVKLFVLLSSIFAVVDHTTEIPIDDLSFPPSATTPYGLSKSAAEAHIANFARSGRIGVSLRPPLVYGKNAKGNWLRLQRLAATQLPLPFGNVHNRRSFIAVENLVDALVRVVSSATDRDVSGVYAVADEDVVSTADTVKWLRDGMGLSPRLLPVDVGILNLLLNLTGQTSMAQSLLGNLEVNSSRFRRVFQWEPPVTSREGIKASGAQFLAGRR